MQIVFSLGANMRRFVTIPVVMVAVVLGAVPALRAGAQLVDPRVSEQLVTADKLVSAGQVVTTDTALLPGTTADLTGTLVDSACYLRGGRAAISADHAKCAIACAQKGSRLALVTDSGDVYMVIGAVTQDNNAKLISLINRSIVLSGVVGTRDVTTAVPTVSSRTDTRRQSTTQDAVVTAKTVRTGDFREGDIPDAPEMTIEPTGIKLLK